MISKLEHSSKTVADKIFNVFQRSYQIEAELINVAYFPPLSRTAAQIAEAHTAFYGYIDNDSLAGVIELTIKDHRLEIDSLTVNPSHFKQGIASKLLKYALQKMDFSQALVETAAANIPAINLYKKHGFNEYKQWVPDHGIPKIALLNERKLYR